MVSWILSSILLTAVAGQADCTIVYFGSARCQPCEQIMPALTRLQQEGWDIRAVNAPDRTDLVTQYKVENLPTVVIVSSSGRQEVDRIVGAVSYEQLLSRFSRAAARQQSSPGSPQSQPTQAQALPLQSPAASVAAGGLIVRGQSPNVGGFPMLAAGGIAPAVATAVGGALAPNLAQPTALAASSVGSAPTAKLQLSLEQAIARAAAATVRIKVEEANTTAYGTGTIVDVHGSEALVLTCGHLFRDMKPGSQLSVDLFAGTPQEVNVLAQLIDFKAEGDDIGLVSFPLPVELEAVEILPRGEKLQTGQPAFSFGCDHGDDPTRRDTKIRSVDRYLGAANVEIVGAPAVGRSGGGLFDLQGRLIGVCNAACVQEDEGIYAAAEVVYTQIERLGMSHLFENRPAAATQLASGGPTLDAAVQPAIYAQPVGEAAKYPAAPQPTEAIAWPDQQLDQQLAGIAAEVATADSQEIICIVRQGTGQSRVVTIARPSPELLNAIQQQAGGQSVR